MPFLSRPPAPAPVFRAARRHSLTVKVLRWVLPLSTLAFAGFMWAAAHWRGAGPNVIVGPVSLQGSTLVMDKPLLEGLDKNGNPYRVEAREARQDITQPKQVELAGLQARLTLSSNNWAKLTGHKGHLDADKELVRLTDGVAMDTSYGYRLETQAITIETKAGSMTTQTPVRLTQGANTLYADRLVVEDSGSVLRFEGHVRMQVVPQGHDEGQGPP